MAKKKEEKQDTTRASKSKMASTKLSKKKEEEEVEAISEEEMDAPPEEEMEESSADEVSEEEIEEESAEEEVPAKGSRKTGKIGSGRGSKPAMKPAPKPAAPKVQAYPMICSECYEEYDLAPGKDAENITCPACGHSCTMPDGDFFSKFALFRSQEKKHVFIGALVIMVMVALAFGWLYVLMNPAVAMKLSLMDETLKPQKIHYAFGGAIFVCLILMILEIVNYERNIYHGYF